MFGRDGKFLRFIHINVAYDKKSSHFSG